MVDSTSQQAPEQPLYRQQAVLYVGQRAFGGVMIKQPLTLVSLTIFMMLVTAVVLIFLKNGEYARKVTVTGYLKPDVAISNIVPLRPGVVDAVMVQDGAFVEKDQPLLRIKQPYVLGDGEQGHAAILVELNQRLNNIDDAVVRAREQHEADTVFEHKRMQSLQNEQRQLLKVLQLQVSRTHLATQQLSAVRDLHDRGYLSNNQFLNQEAAFLTEQKELGLLQQGKTRSDAVLSKISHRLTGLPAILADRLALFEQQKSELRQQITESKGRAAYLVNAPISGRVTAVNVRVGELVTRATPMLSIVPTNASLYAWLQVPSRAAGFVKAGQKVRLMFDSFPYQQFGTLSGTLESITKIAQASVDATGSPVAAMPTYRAKVRLEKSFMRVFGEDKPLQVDMSLSADIVQAKRSIFDWMIEPLYTLRGRTK